MDVHRPLTRSQQPDPAAVLRSPLATAKQRTYPDNDDNESDDEILLSPKTRSKRTASPSPPDIPAIKRLKFDPDVVRDSENTATTLPTHSRNISEPIFIRGSKPGTPNGRARSVPLLVPARTTKSPRRARSRSPSKEREMPATLLSFLPPIQESSMPPPASPPPVIVETPSTPQPSTSSAFDMPLSPLTPLPETPRPPTMSDNSAGMPRTIGWGTDLEEVQRIDGLPATMDAFPPIVQPTQAEPETQVRDTAEPSRPVAKPPAKSLLPRPSMAPPLLKPATKAVPKPVPQPKAGASSLKPPVASSSRPAPPKNAFDTMMNSDRRGSDPEPKGKGKGKATAAAGSSKATTKVMAAKDKGKGKAKAEETAVEAKKPTVRGKMRAREKPKPAPIPMLVRLPDEDDELPHTPDQLGLFLPAPQANSTRSMSPLTDLGAEEEMEPAAVVATVPKDEPPLSPLTEPMDDDIPIPPFDAEPLSPLTEPTDDDVPIPPMDEAPLSPLTEPTDDDAPPFEALAPPPSSSPVQEAEIDLGASAQAADIEMPPSEAAAESSLLPITAIVEEPQTMDAEPAMVEEPQTALKSRPRSRAAAKPRPPPPLPAADRVTRSSALKRKEAEDGPTQRTLLSFGVGPGPAKKQKLDSSQSKIPIPSPSKISSFASPTKASAARAAATKKPVSAAAGPSSSSPTKNRLERASSVFNARPPPSFARTFTEGSSSSQLATALERLRAPPPSRPNTSMGFSRDDSDPTLAESTRSADDRSIGLGRPSGGLQRATTVAVLETHSDDDTTTKPTLTQRPLPSFLTSNKPALQSTAKLMVGNGALLRSGPGFLGAGRGRAAPKVSRNPGLPSVIGSPVKGGGSGMVEEDGDATMLHEEDEAMSEIPFVPVVDAEGVAEHVTSPRSVMFDLESLGIEPLKKGKKKVLPDEWRKNADRRASMAFSDLSKSISLPVSMGPPEVPAERVAMRSSSSSYPSTSTASTSEASGSTAVEGLRRSTRIPKIAPAADTSTEQESTAGPSTSTTPAPVQLTVLKGCVVFVDIISESGDDSLRSYYTETLKTLGARVLGSVGQTLTHIVYKNGLRSTYSKYKALSEPRPFLVGMEWVVKCAETLTRHEEEPYLLDEDDMNTKLKRRKTMMPSGIWDDEPSFEASSTSIVVDDDLPPMERARQRKAAGLL
ncbi:BRCT domain-containing protein [Mycena chlorophos]|uniref:BRCT domain-containing protein n=1 Tax=Mycena chlorophos TaxID=658473 RepID=A0A8H6SG76_MYCCL|nr:BRCT domain-containing protein [Mycena chlorophos]